MNSNIKSKEERLNIVLDIATKLKFYNTPQGGTINLYNDEYSFVPELKKIFNEYVKQDDDLALEFSGILRFEEINKWIEYKLPIKKDKEPLFVIRIKK
jgi:hypothetical protein